MQNIRYSYQDMEGLTRKSPFCCFSFPDISYTFFISFRSNFVRMYSIILFIFLVKVHSALCWWNTRPLTLSEFKIYYKLYQGTAWVNIKLVPVPERFNSPVEFHGKNDQRRKNLGKLTFFEKNFLNFFNGKPCQSLSVGKA